MIKRCNEDEIRDLGSRLEESLIFEEQREKDRGSNEEIVEVDLILPTTVLPKICTIPQFCIWKGP